MAIHLLISGNSWTYDKWLATDQWSGHTDEKWSSSWRLWPGLRWTTSCRRYRNSR